MRDTPGERYLRTRQTSDTPEERKPSRSQTSPGKQAAEDGARRASIGAERRALRVSVVMRGTTSYFYELETPLISLALILAASRSNTCTYRFLHYCDKVFSLMHLSLVYCGFTRAIGMGKPHQDHSFQSYQKRSFQSEP